MYTGNHNGQNKMLSQINIWCFLGSDSLGFSFAKSSSGFVFVFATEPIRVERQARAGAGPEGNK